MGNLLRLMIVEDEDSLRRGLCHAMPWEELGFEVVCAAQNADEALEFLSCRAVDVVLTDIRMPGMSGLELARGIRECDSEIQVVIISGYDDFTYAQTALRVGAVDYLLKPINKNRLIEVFNQLGRQIKARRARNAHRQKYEAMAEEYVLLRIVSGEYRSEDELEELLGRIGFYPEGAYRVVVFAGMAGAVRQLRDVLQRRLGRTLLTTSARHAVALIGDNQLDQALLAVQPLLAGAVARARVGSAYTDLYNMVFSYQEALREEGGIGDAGAAAAQVPGKRQVRLQHAIIESLEQGDLSLWPKLLEEARAMFAGDLLAAKSFLTYSLGELSRYFGLLEHNGERIEIDLRALMPAEDMDALISAYRAQLLRFHAYFLQVRNSPTEASVQRACHIASCSFEDPTFSMSRAADELGISYSYLSTIFKHVMGQGFSQYVTALRMERARQLLLEGGLKVNEIAQRVGLVNARYLTESFKKAYGVTPSEYVARMGKEHASQDDT